MPRLDPSVRDSSIQGERNRGGRGVGVAINRYDHLVLRQAELSAHTVDDAAVCLMRDKPVDIRRGKAVRREGLVDHRAQMLDRQPEDLTSFHPQKAHTAGRRRAAIDIEDVVLASVRMQMVREDKAAARRRGWDRPQNEGPGSVSEKDAG